MSIHFYCQACGSPLKVNDEHAGGECDCPSCGTKVTILLSQDRAVHESNDDTQPPFMSPPKQNACNAGPTEPSRKGFAIAALACGIFGFCFFPLALVAIVLGIIALVKISHHPKEYSGEGLAKTGICVAIIALIVTPILILTLARIHELSRRSVCAANFKGMGSAFYRYANENSGMWPIPPHIPSDSGTVGMVDYTQAIGSYRGKAGNPTAGDVSTMDPLPSKLSTTRGLWTLFRYDLILPQLLICPSSGATPNTDTNPQNYWDFGQGDITGSATVAQAHQGWQQVSYGYQVPFGRHGQPSLDCESSMILAADKGPYGAAIEAGEPMPGPITAMHQSSPDAWRPWNSPNHGGQGKGEGQNVLFADGHVEWRNTPAADIQNDNIYTQWSGKGLTEKECTIGNPPTLGGKQTPVSNTDSLIYP